MARYFKGFRLDNAHGTPVHVSSYLMKKAREINPDLIVMAELYTNDPHVDSIYISNVGINLLIRESMQIEDYRHLAGYLNDCAIEHQDFELRSVLKPTRNPSILYDFSHDNPTPSQSRTSQDALPNSALVSLTNSAIASTLAYDDLIPHQISVVFDQRQYSTHSDLNDDIPEYFLTGSRGIKVLVQHYSAKAKTVEIRGD